MKEGNDWSTYVYRRLAQFKEQRAQAGRTSARDLTERFVIRPNSTQYDCLDKTSRQVTSIYNMLVYQYRHNFLCNHWINYRKINHKALQWYRSRYQSLPTIDYFLKVVHRVQELFRDFEKREHAFKEHPGTFDHRPKLPHYHKKKSCTSFEIDVQDVTIQSRQLTIPSLHNLSVGLRKNINSLSAVWVVPKADVFMLDIIHQSSALSRRPDNRRYLAIDPGLNNAFTLTSNVSNLRPVIINGRPLKSYNRYWNQRVDHLKALYAKYHQSTNSHALYRLQRERYLKMERFAHAASRYIIDYAQEKDLNTIIIGDNRSWWNSDYQDQNNEHSFLRIPYQTFVDKLIYKGAHNGIPVLIVNESYTSQTSFLDNERPNWNNGDANRKRNYILPNSRRVHRGLFRTNQHRLINADVNGSLQILRKVVPDAFDGIRGIGLYPVKHNVDF